MMHTEPDMRHVSTTVMVEQLTGLLDTRDLTEWEQRFVRNLDRIRSDGKITTLSDTQVETLDELFHKHFA